MTRFTEKAIAEAFWELLDAKPIDKITVTEICERVGISRNTFYYHFADVYDVVEELFRDEEARLATASADIATIEQGLRESTRLAAQNQRAVRHLYESSERDRIVRGIFNRTRLKAYMTAPERGTEEGFAKTVDYVSRLAYFITFLLFVPAIFTTLGAGNASESLIQLLNDIWGYVPNIVGAVVVLIAGLLIARLVRELLVPAFRKIKVDKLQEKAGVAVDDKSRLSETLAYIVYVLIVIPVIIVALQVLNISAISEPATGMLDTVINFIPYLAVGIIIVLVGVFVGRLAGNIVGQLIATTGIDAKLNDAYDGKLGAANLSKIVNYVIQAIIIVFFTVEGLNVLHLDVLTNIGTAIVGYLPNILAAFIVFALAAFSAGWAGKAIRKGAFASDDSAK